MLNIVNKALLSHFQKVDQLSINNPEYQRILDELFLFLARYDHVKEDVTVQTFLPRGVGVSTKNGVIVAKSSCVTAGVEEVVYLCKKHTKLTPKVFISDGKKVEPGTKLLEFSGSAKDILAYERTFLNILQRMSGIATETQKYVAKVKSLRLTNPSMIAATRKTPWMQMDKKAVAVGGGVTHRLDLHDGILLKDNHLALLQQLRLPQPRLTWTRSLRGTPPSPSAEDAAISYAISNAKINDQNIAVEVEVKSEDAAFAAVKAFQKRKLKNPFIILLDNFTPERVKEIVKEIIASDGDVVISSNNEKSHEISHSVRDDNDGSNIFFEASGGINLENVADFAKTGVDIISVGALTHSPKAADFSLDIV